MPGPWYERAFGDHYPLLYAHRDEAEAKLCLDLIMNMAPIMPPGTTLPVLDLCCGDGRHAQYLAGRLPSVLGLDLSESLLALAKKRVKALKSGHIGLIRGDMRKIPLANQSCGSVLSLFTSFGYFGDLNSNAGVVHEISRILAPGGHWFFDYLNCDSVRRELGDLHYEDRRERVLGPCRFTEVRKLGVRADTVVKDVSVVPVPGCEGEAARFGIGAQGLQYSEQVALFSVAEIDQVAHQAGLRRIASAGDYQGSALGDGSRWLLVYQKRG